jgi:hypothetical protein
MLSGMSGETSPEVQNLEHHECWAMLRTVSVGRLAVLSDGRPDIFPINYTVDGGTLVFRTGEGSRSWQAPRKAPRLHWRPTAWIRTAGSPGALWPKAQPTSSPAPNR